jgi:glycosyltransferase involved in cell wall biosynthesis
MRVGLTSDFFPPSLRGGAEISCQLLAEALGREGVEVHVLTPSFSGRQSSVKMKGFTTHYYLFPFRSAIKRRVIIGNPLFYLWSYWSISKCVDRLGLDLVHAQNKYSIPGSALAARSRQIPVFATVRDTLPLCEFAVCTLKGETKIGVDCGFLRLLRCTREFQELYDLEGNVLSKALKWMPLTVYAKVNSSSLRFFLERVDQIVAVSEGLKEIYVESGLDSSMITVVPNIVPPVGQQKAMSMADLEILRDRFNLRSEDKVVLYVGRLSWGKGVHLLLEAMVQVLSKLKDAKLVIVGEGILKSILEERVMAQGISDSVLFLGQIDHDKVLDLYPLANVVVSPSVWPEPLSRVHLEAMSARRPIVASKVGGNLETVVDGKTGLLVASGDIDSLAESIIYLLENPRVAQDFGERGREEAQLRFGVSETARKMIDLYEKWLD